MGMTPLLVASISILDLFYRTYAWGPETGLFYEITSFVLEDQVKNPVSLWECVSPVLLIRVLLTPMVLINCVLLWQVLAKLVCRPLFPYSGAPPPAGGWEFRIVLRSCWLVLATILTKCGRLCRRSEERRGGAA